MGFLSKLGGYLVMGGTALAALFGLLYRASRQGRAEAEAERTAKGLEQAKESNEIGKEVRGATDAELAARLRKHQRD